MPGGIDSAHAEGGNAGRTAAMLADDAAGCAKSAIGGKGRALAKIAETGRRGPPGQRARRRRLGFESRGITLLGSDLRGRRRPLALHP